jgi:hypothetical protein
MAEQVSCHDGRSRLFGCLGLGEQGQDGGDDELGHCDAPGVGCLQPPEEEDFGGRLAGYADPDGLPFWVGDKSGKS